MSEVLIKTSLGDIRIKLYDETPLHRDNFLKLAGEDFYDGLLFHRVIKDFMIQGGDPDSKNAPKGRQLGSGDPGYTIPAEIRPEIFHKRGALAAARTADSVNPERRSSGSQFYIVWGQIYGKGQIEQMNSQLRMQAEQEVFNRLASERRLEITELYNKNDQNALLDLQNELIAQTKAEMEGRTIGLSQEQIQAYTTVGGTPHLDGAYTVYGEVTEGMDVVEQIQNVSTDTNDRPLEDIRILSTTVL